MIQTVNKYACLSLAMLLTSMTFVPSVHAHESAIGTMAMIVHHLNHYPTDEEIRQLRAIDQEATSPEIHILAGALIRMRHTVQPEDAAALRKLTADSQASEQVRELAAILLHFQHHPSAADKEQLRALMGGDD